MWEGEGSQEIILCINVYFSHYREVGGGAEGYATALLQLRLTEKNQKRKLCSLTELIWEKK